MVRSRIWPDLLEKGRMNPRFGEPRLLDTIASGGRGSHRRKQYKRVPAKHRNIGAGPAFAVPRKGPWIIPITKSHGAGIGTMLLPK